ncbi:MAG: metallopeptidase TldD-related protein [Turneriella sp.]
MKSLVAVLRKTRDLRGWQLSRLRKRSTEIYCVQNEIETIRCNLVNNYALRLQTPVEGGDAALMGESTTRFQGRPESLPRLVQATAARARLVRNPAYNFPEQRADSGDDSNILDAAVSEAHLDMAVDYAERVQKFHKRSLASFPLNSLELFLEDFDFAIENNRGLQIESNSTRVICDYVLTSPDNRHEIMGIKKRRFLRDLDLEEQFEQDAAVLSDLERAVLPPTGEYPVVLAGDALDNLFDFFVAQLDGHALFNRYSIFQHGDAVLREPREDLTILSQPDRRGGMRSYRFDELGFVTGNVTLIENSRVKNFLVDGRYADLLKIPRTSALMNIEVACGMTPYADFLSDGVLELSKFSTFQPNTISGAFSGKSALAICIRTVRKYP